MGQVEWTELVGEQAETLLAVLLYNKYPEATRVRPSQGDFGIDVLVPNSSVPGTFDVYQIKKFAQSLTASQKGQVEESFRRLLIGLVRRNVPVADWYLVMPLDPTVDNFLDWFNEMPDRVIPKMFEDGKLTLTEDEKDKITAWRNPPERVIKWEGRPLCITLASTYPNVVDYYLHGGRERILKAFKDLSSIYLVDSVLPDPSTADEGTAALLTPAELQDHLFELQEVLDTDPHFRYGISLDPTPPEIVDEPDLVAATQVTQPDGRTLTVRIKQRFAEALRERPIPIKVTFLASDATFDQQAFEMWRKYGMPLVAAPAEVDIDLPGGLGKSMSGGVTQVTALGTPGHTSEVRFRIRQPDGTAGDELLFSLTASTGPEGTGVWETGTDTTGILTFESTTDLESHMGTWTFKRGSIVGREVVEALPIIEFLQDLGAPNVVVQAAQKYGPYADYHDIPEPSKHQFPESLMQFLRALANIQSQSPTPIVIPDLTTVTVGELRAVTQAAALVSGQTVLDTWDSFEVVRDGSRAEASDAQEVDFASEYQLLTTDKLVVDVGGQSLTLGTLSWLLLSVRQEVEGDRLIARPFRNDTVQKNFSPLPDAAGPLERRVLGRIIGRIEDSDTPAETN